MRAPRPGPAYPDDVGTHLPFPPERRLARSAAVAMRTALVPESMLGVATPLVGITEFWQVRGSSTFTFDAMVKVDLAHVDRRSLPLELWILAPTPFAVLRRRRAA